MACRMALKQHVIVEWLRQELDRSRLHGLDRHRHVAVARDEDDRHVNPIGGDALLQFETIEVRKINVKYQAARNEDSGRARNSCADANVSGCQPRSGSTPPMIRAPRYRRQQRIRLVWCATWVMTFAHGTAMVEFMVSPA